MADSLACCSAPSGAAVGVAAFSASAFPFKNGVGDQRTEKLHGANGVIIAGDRVIDQIRITIGVTNGDHRNFHAARFQGSRGVLP